MSATTPPLHGDELLAAVTDAMVALHERYHHRPPGSAKTQMLGDDLIAVVMGEVYTEVEKTMIEIQHSPIVQATRSSFQQAMGQRFIDEVERLSGRQVIAFVSDSHVGPDMEIELFVLRELAQHPGGRADAEHLYPAQIAAAKVTDGLPAGAAVGQANSNRSTSAGTR